MPASNASAAELIARMRTSYAIASSYADRGTATHGGTTRVSFQTSFVRGRRFRFEYRDGFGLGECVIWSDGEHTYTCRHSQAGRSHIVEDGADIGMAIGAATGVSSGTAWTVPAMLLPVSIGSAGHGLAELADVILDGDEDIGSCRCARLVGRTPKGHLTTLWIDRATYLLRRLVRIGELSNSKFETTTSYEPSLAPLDASSIECPDLEATPPRWRGPLRWIGINIAVRSTRVDELDEGSPAARAGLAIGDEVEAMNGQRMDFLRLIQALLHAKIGDRLALTIRRGADTLDIVVPVEAHPPREFAVPSSPLVE